MKRGLTMMPSARQQQGQGHGAGGAGGMDATYPQSMSAPSDALMYLVKKAHLCTQHTEMCGGGEEDNRTFLHA